MTGAATPTGDAGAAPASDHDPRRGEHRVAITGMGAITAGGLDVASMWDAVVGGRSAITTLDGPEFEGLPVRIGGRVTGFDTAGILAPALARRLSPVQHWAVAAADQALRQAGILDDAVIARLAAAAPSAASATDPPELPWPRHRFAIIAATGSGPVDAMQAATRALDARGPRAVPFTLSVYGAPDAAASVLAQRYGARGTAPGMSATCASGAVGLGTGLRWIRHGYADAVLVVGMEDCLNPVNLASNATLRALAAGYEDDPAAACRPFDRGRTGFVMSAGAAAMLLESDEAVRARRGAPAPGQEPGRNRAAGRTHAGEQAHAGPPVAELAGFGAASDAHHPTAPDPAGRGAARAVRDCLADAGTEAERIDHINVHGTGTPLGDAAEITALAAVFGDRARRIPLSATKSSTGHLLGASGVLEAVIAVQTLRTGLLPPTINLTDPEFPDWDIVTGAARPAAVRSVLSTTFGFGGHNGALLIHPWHDRDER